MNIDDLHRHAGAIRRGAELREKLRDCRNIRIAIVRERSASERENEYQQPGHGIMFCLHNKHYFHVCSNCKRTQREANDNRERFMARVS